MSDLISRSALLKRTTFMWDEAIGTEECVWAEDIVNAPAVDAVPVVHGRWERNIVIKCGLKHHEGFNASCCGRWSKYRTPYCPNCGAKMDGGNNG